jgi:hypothetical protein
MSPACASSGEVAGVVEAAYGGEVVVVPLDLVEAGGAEVHPVEGGRVKPSHLPKSVSRSSSSMVTGRPSSAAAISAVAAARCNGEVITASICPAQASRRAAALASKMPFSLSGTSRMPLNRCSGARRVSPCRSSTVVVGGPAGVAQPSVMAGIARSRRTAVRTAPRSPGSARGGPPRPGPARPREP